MNRSLKLSIDKMQHDFNDNNDSSTISTNRSVHLPVEKQRSLSEIIRKRNSRYKVEDYKRSFQKFHTFDEELSEHHRPLTTSTSDYALSNNNQTTVSANTPREIKRLTKTKSVDIPTKHDEKQTPTWMENSEANKNNSGDQISNKYVIN